jgi:hypothetical protein
MQENDRCGKLIYFKIFGENRADFCFVLQIIKVFKITRYICMNFPNVECKFKLKFESSQNFELQL